MKVECPYCHQPAKLVTGEVIYPHRPDLFDRKFWQCKPCNAYVGTHKSSPVHMPLGRLANAELRLWKQKAHLVFDKFWKNPMTGLTRNEAYMMLADKMGIPREQCHIGMFDVEQCKETERIANEWTTYRKD